MASPALFRIKGYRDATDIHDTGCVSLSRGHLGPDGQGHTFVFRTPPIPNPERYNCADGDSDRGDCREWRDRHET